MSEETKVETKTAKEEVKKEVKQDDKKRKGIRKRTLIVLVLLVITLLAIGIKYKASYLNVLEIGERFENVFYSKVAEIARVSGGAFVGVFFLSLIINSITKSGIKKFFEDEKKEMPKLPNKSISFCIALFAAIFANFYLRGKYSMFMNASVFGQADPVFGYDIGYYLFKIPFIVACIRSFIILFGIYIGVTALYYVIVLNTYFDGVDGELLKKSSLVKQILVFAIIIVTLFCSLVYINAQNTLTETMMTIGEGKNQLDLIGAGSGDVTVKVWGYRVLAVLVVICAILILRAALKKNFKNAIIVVSVVPIYLIVLFLVLTYYQVHLNNNEFDREKQYISYNIEYTKKGYGIDIDQKNIKDYSIVTQADVDENKKLFSNVPLITEEATLKTLAAHKENSVYYSSDYTFLSRKGDNIYYVTPREVLDDSKVSYENRTYKYTHGYSAYVTSVTDSDSDGYAEYILSDTKQDGDYNITQPRIYFGLNTNSTILTNTDFGKEYDYPITNSTFGENVYDGEAGLSLGFWDRLILGLSERNFNLAFSRYINENTKIVFNRNILSRAKTILPDIIYDENPYMVLTDAGRLVWVIDGYTRSNSYPYSQQSNIVVDGNKEKINYIRNSVKVLIDAYDGTTKFYITDRTDPIIMIYNNMYPDLFEKEENQIPDDIKSSLKYPKYLFDIQSKIIDIYHDVSEDTLYRMDDVWEITKDNSQSITTTAGSQMDSKYTMFKTNAMENPELGIVITYNKVDRQSITSYLAGTVENGYPKLSLYKFNSENNIVGPVQLNNQIEQDDLIDAELKALNTSGVKLTKSMIIIPINNTLLYVEPVYQSMLNEKTEIPKLVKVIVASGNKVAIGDNLSIALQNLFNENYSVNLEFIDVEDIDTIIDAVIRANNNLKGSIEANDMEMVGKDIASLQSIIDQLEKTRQEQLLKEENVPEEQEVPEVDENGNPVTNTTEEEHSRVGNLITSIFSESRDTKNTTNTTNTVTSNTTN